MGAASSRTRVGRRTSRTGRPRERRSPNPQLLTLPETAALLLASLQRPQEAGEENFDQTRILEDY
ncbi:spexin isoform X1 [Prionailurus iriomotensis]